MTNNYSRCLVIHSVRSQHGKKFSMSVTHSGRLIAEVTSLMGQVVPVANGCERKWLLGALLRSRASGQFASGLASDVGSEAPFHSRWIHWTRDPGLLRTQSMVPNLCFWKQQPFLSHNFKGKSICCSILSLQVATGCLSFQCNFVLLFQ